MTIERILPQKENREERAHYTLAMIKPDGIQQGIVDEFEGELAQKDITLLSRFPIFFDRESIFRTFRILRELSEFGDDWKEDVAQALQEGSCLAYVLSGENVIEKVLQIRDSIRQKHTNRADYSQRVVKNLIHASDSAEEAELELTVMLEIIDTVKQGPSPQKSL